MMMKVQTTSTRSRASSIQLGGVARDIPAMAVGDWIGAEHSNQTHPSREWLSVAVSRVMLSRDERAHFFLTELSDKQVFTIVLHWIQALRNCR